MKLTKSRLRKIIKEELQKALNEQERLVEPPEPWYEKSRPSSMPYGISPFVHGRPQYEKIAGAWPKPDYSYHMIDVLQAGRTHPDYDAARDAAETYLGPIGSGMATQEFNIQQLHDQLSYENLQSKWLKFIGDYGRVGGSSDKPIGWMNLDLKARYPRLHRG